jgi:uncharacterized alkaline shock family protein YloU
MISIKNEYGEIRISEEAIAEIASCAAMQCYGVVGLAGRTFPKGTPDFLKKSLQKGVLVSQREDDSYDLDLYVVIEYGTRLAEAPKIYWRPWERFPPGAFLSSPITRTSF